MGIQNLNFYEPADAIDLYNIFSHVFKENKGVNYIRLSKENSKITRDETDLKNIVAYYVHKSSENPDLVFMSSGFTVKNCVEAAKLLEIGFNIKTNVVNVVNIKELEKCLPQLITNDAPILAVYNGSKNVFSHYIGSAIISDCNIPRPKAFLSHGFEIGTTGKICDLINYYGFDAESIKCKALKLL